MYGLIPPPPSTSVARCAVFSVALRRGAEGQAAGSVRACGGQRRQIQKWSIMHNVTHGQISVCLFIQHTFLFLNKVSLQLGGWRFSSEISPHSSFQPPTESIFQAVLKISNRFNKQSASFKGERSCELQATPELKGRIRKGGGCKS